MINGRARRPASTCPKEELAKANGTMGGISARGGDGIPIVVLVPPHLVAGPLVLGLKLAVATAESLRSSRSELGSCLWRGTRGRIHQRT